MPTHDEALAGPSSAIEVRRAYLDRAGIGYIVYFVGAVTAFLAVSLSLSDAQAGMHSSAIAVGMVSASLISGRLDRLVGIRVVHLVGLTSLLVGGLLIVWVPAFGVTLIGALAVGAGAGLILGHVNQTLSAGGGVLARVQMTRSTVVAMVSSVTVPLVIGLGIAIGIGWQFVIVPALALVGIAIATNWGRRDSAARSSLTHGRLPSSFWLPWFLVLLVVAMEFAVVFWGSTLVERRADVSLADATLTISAFVAGMIVARLAFSTHALSSHDPVWLMRIGTITALFGTLLLWATASYELSATGMFITGIGVGLLYPLAASMALAAAPSQSATASARVVMGTGLAILVAPLVLGVVADMTDVVAAWLLIPAACVVSLALTLPLARAHDGREALGVVRT